ncbi:MAG: substrate-binding domain-containing protein [Casimicrobiaceae bacterium]
MSASAGAADLRIMAPNAVKEVVTHAAERYERASGNHTVLTWSGSEAIAKRIGEGEVFDVVLNTPQNLDTLAKAGKIMPSTRTDFAKSGIGIAVRAGRTRFSADFRAAARPWS